MNTFGSYKHRIKNNYAFDHNQLASCSSPASPPRLLLGLMHRDLHILAPKLKQAQPQPCGQGDRLQLLCVELGQGNHRFPTQ